MVVKASPKWNETTNRFVAFMDIMGFEEMVSRNTHESVLSMMESFLPEVKLFEQIANIKLNDRENSSIEAYHINSEYDVMPIIFSDSILLISNSDSSASAAFIMSAAAWIFAKALEKGIPIKGAIAWGMQTDDPIKSLHFGRPLIDAYKLQNELSLYGIVLHHSAEKYLIDNNTMQKFKNSKIFKYPTPLKNGIVNHFILGEFVSYLKDDIEHVLSNLYLTVSGYPRLYVDNTLIFGKWLTNEISSLE